MNPLRPFNNKINLIKVISPIIFKSDMPIKPYPTFNVLIKSNGKKDNLEKILDSLCDELTENDTIIIVFDNNSLREISNLDKLKCMIMIYNEEEKLDTILRLKYTGSILTPRTFVVNIDDNSNYTYCKGAFDKLRCHCASDSECIYLTNTKESSSLYKDPVYSSISLESCVIPHKYNININYINHIVFCKTVCSFRNMKIDINIYE